MQANDVKQDVRLFANAAIQNQMLEMSDAIKVLRAESIPEAEEFLMVGEEKMQKRKMDIEERKISGQKELMAMEEENKKADHERAKELIILKEEENRKTEIQKQVILAMGFNEDKDIDNDNIPDVLEVATKGVELALKDRKQSLDERKFEHQKEVDKEKIKIENKKASKSTSK
jgi:hypothetical protein